MKRILLALAIFGLLLPATRQAEAGVDVSIDFFYNNLGDDGSWVEVDDYGYCWQPSVAVSNSDWRPYSDGYWAYTDVGWTWVSYESFGWATYHYGRWARVRDHGWLWVPGREWGPAWVSWRTGGDQVGWAPLPPRRYSGCGSSEVVYEGRPIGGQVDIEFDIGPAYYNFVDVRYIGAPVLREHIYAPAQNVTYINSTVNVTNITYNNSTVYNYGPDYNRLSAYSDRPIQRLSLQRQTDVDLNAAAQSGSLTQVQGNTLMVAAPQQFQKPAQPIAPRVVKAKIAKPDLETGWMGVSSPTAKAEMQQKMRAEDPKTIPPAKMQPQNPAALTAASPTPITPASPAPAASPKNPAATAAPAVPKTSPAATVAGSAASSPLPTASVAPTAGNQKNRGQTGQSPAPSISPAKGLSPTATAAPKEDAKIRNGELKPVPSPAATIAPRTAPTPAASATPAARLDDQLGKGRKANPPTPAITPADAISTPQDGSESIAPEGRGLKKKNGMPADSPPNTRLQQGAATGTQPGTQPPPPRLNVPTPGPAVGVDDLGREGRKVERLNVPAPSKPATDLAPPPPQDQPAVGRNRQVAPAQVAPQGGPANVPAVVPGSSRGPEKGNKKEKKGDEPPPSPAPDSN